MCFNDILQCSLTAALAAFKASDPTLQKLKPLFYIVNLVLLSPHWY